MRSEATSVDAHVESVPAERKTALQAAPPLDEFIDWVGAARSVRRARGDHR